MARQAANAKSAVVLRTLRFIFWGLFIDGSSHGIETTGTFGNRPEARLRRPGPRPQSHFSTNNKVYHGRFAAVKGNWIPKSRAINR